jgi:hypothetical protein
MSAVLADPAFWYGLALKIAMTASTVVAASVVVESSGPFIGSLIGHDHSRAQALGAVHVA